MVLKSVFDLITAKDKPSVEIERYCFNGAPNLVHLKPILFDIRIKFIRYPELPADAARYGEFVPVICSRGDVRITMPEIPHGSTRMNNDAPVRRIILP